MGLGFMGLTDLGFRVSTVSIVVPFRRFLIGSFNPRHIYIYYQYFLKVPYIDVL